MELDFHGVCKLFLLRYLKIEANVHVQLQLPEKIGELQQLETLDIEWGSVAIPSDIICLPRLTHLIIPESIRLPDGIGNMKSLVTLQSFDLGENSIDNIRGLGQLTNLRDLNLCYIGTSISSTASRVDVLRSSLEMLCNLKHLYMHWPGICGGGLSLLNPSPRHLQTLELVYWCFPKVPEWIAELQELQVLKFAVRELSMDGFLALARLPALTNLGLRTQVSPRGSITVYSSAFPALRYFKYWCRTPLLTFEVGAMPKLERLKLRFKEILESPSGIEHLLGLREVFLEIGGRRGVGKVPKRGGALSVLIMDIDMHPGCPRLRIVSCRHL
jgi:Leucine-rich repeat (LRR) protein